MSEDKPLQLDGKPPMPASLGALGFNETEVSRLLDDDPKLDKDKIERGRLVAEMSFRQKVYEMAMEGNQTAMKEYVLFSRRSKHMLRAVDLPVDYIDFSATEIRLIDGLLMFTGNITKACKYANITRKTYYNWMNDPGISRRNLQLAAQMARDSLDDEVEQVIMDQVLVHQDPKMIQFYARTRMKDRGYTDAIVVTSDDSLAQLPDGSISAEGKALVQSRREQAALATAAREAMRIINEEPAEIAEFTEVDEPSK